MHGNTLQVQLGSISAEKHNALTQVGNCVYDDNYDGVPDYEALAQAWNES